MVGVRGLVMSSRQQVLEEIRSMTKRLTSKYCPMVQEQANCDSRDCINFQPGFEWSISGENDGYRVHTRPYCKLWRRGN